MLLGESLQTNSSVCANLATKKLEVMQGSSEPPKAVRKGENSIPYNHSTTE